MQSKTLFRLRGVLCHVTDTARAPKIPPLFEALKAYSADKLATFEAAEMDHYVQNKYIVKQQIFATILHLLLLKVQSLKSAAAVWDAIQKEMKNKSDMYCVKLQQRT